MRHQKQDPFGSAGSTTEYERDGKPGGSAGSSRTKLAVGVVGVTLALFFAWLAVTPFDSDPAPEGAASVPVPPSKAP